MIKLCIIWIKL